MSGSLPEMLLAAYMNCSKRGDLCDERGYRIKLSDSELDDKRRWMREWFELCQMTDNPDVRETMYEARFEEKSDPVFIRERSASVTCMACGDSGLVFSRGCTPQYRNPHNRSSPGWVTCACHSGKSKNGAVAEMGRRKEPRRSKGGESY